MNDNASLSTILAGVRRPSRYVGGERNVIVKPDPALRICLAFPDTYEIGMSHLGLKILYGLINETTAFGAERVFAPWPDFEARLRRTGTPLGSLETGRPLSAFDAVGFSLQYELCYTNVLAMLACGGIPLRALDRTDRDPVILAGGPCTSNPAPLSDFIDAFLIGDGEEAVPEMLQSLHELHGAGRREKLRALAALPGVYVPEVHGRCPAKPVRRRVVSNLDAAYYPTAPVVPHQAVHNRVAIEVGRGCPRGCRFCQAGMIYRPLRERSMERVLSLAEETLQRTGFDEVSFTSLSAGDYGCLAPLVREINRRLAGRHVAVSLPSLRVGSVDRALLRELRSERKTGYTVAPEAGTERLRRVINKTILEADLLEGLQVLFEEGWETVKLYYMIGLPTETDADLEGILNMAREARRLARQARVRRVNINVSVSTFVPKPHTPFQWLGQTPAPEIRRRQQALRDGLRGRAFHFKPHDPEMSTLESIFSRGDAEAGRVLRSAYEKGARFDGWSDGLRMDLWEQALSENGLDPAVAASRNYGPDDPLPWGAVDPGVSRAFLKKEYNRAVSGEFSDECRENCLGCGVGCKSLELSEPPQRPSSPAATEVVAGRQILLSEPTRFRVKYEKSGALRYLSHLELKETILRALRGAGLRTAYSQGFHPHPKVSFGPALGVGVAGTHEYFDMDLLSPLEPRAGVALINGALPEGVRVLEICRAEGRPAALDRFISRYVFRVRFPDNAVPKRIADAERRKIERTDRKGEVRRIDLAPCIEAARLEGGVLELILQDRGSMRVRIAEVVEVLLELDEEERDCLVIERGEVHGFANGWVTPMEASGMKSRPADA